jgi:putative transposase
MLIKQHQQRGDAKYCVSTPMSEDLYKDKYRIASARWAGYDYSQNGMYFITICTHNRQPYFGDILASPILGGESILNASALGQRAVECWDEIPKHFPFAVPSTFVVMPDHVHGIVFFTNLIRS